MTDSHRSAQSKDHSTPRWAIVLGLITVAIILLAVVMMLVGGGEHSPRRHGDPNGIEQGESHVPPPGFGDHTPPEGMHP